MLEHKFAPFVEWKFSSGDGPGEFEGYAAVFNNLDDGGDIILPGAFKNVLDSFTREGFVPIGHNWYDLPVATIASATEDEKGLFIRAEFHSTTEAQSARTVMRERLERGKSAGLSIGYLVDYENNGAELREDGVRLIHLMKELPETSFVTIPMNRLAGATNAKSSGRSFADETDAALAAVASFVDRAKALAALRVKEGRVLSQANRDRLTKIRDASLLASQDLDMILAETDPEKGAKAARVAALRYRRLKNDAALLIAAE